MKRLERYKRYDLSEGEIAKLPRGSQWRVRKQGYLTVREFHGQSKSPTYKVWAAMLSRCHNPKSNKYKDYGARGITVCDRWLSFNNFFADMGEKPEGLTIDRINNSLGYSPENCRWATATQQARNTRNNTFFEHEGRKQTLADWAEERGLTPHRVYNRMSKGWTIKEALGL